LHRVTLAMRVLFSPTGEAIPSAPKLRKQARVLGETLHGLQGVEDRLRVLDDRFDAVATLFGHLQGQEANQTLIAEIRQGMSVVARYANDIADQMAVVRFPFDHAEGEVSVGRYLLDQRADPDDINSTMGSAGELLSRALGLQTRCLGRLCRIAERVEQHLDLPPMTVPTAK